MSAKLTREDLISLACDGQEIIIARNVPHAAIKHNTMVNASVLNNSKALKERCQKELGLCLSPLAQQRKGRPKKCDDVTGIAWFGGKVYEKVAERAKSPDPKVGSHGPAAFQTLAEMAVNIEPFTRLLDKSSKEKLPVACPNLKIGDKKTASPPPFFVAPSS